MYLKLISVTNLIWKAGSSQMLVMRCIHVIVHDLTFHPTHLKQKSMSFIQLTALKQTPWSSHFFVYSTDFWTWRTAGPYGRAKGPWRRQRSRRLRHRTAVGWRASNAWTLAKTLLHPSLGLTCVCLSLTYLWGLFVYVCLLGIDPYAWVYSAVHSYTTSLERWSVLNGFSEISGYTVIL